MLLADLVIESTVTFNGNIETVMKDLVTRTAIAPSDKERVIKHLRLGAVTGMAGTLNTQATGDNLSEKLYEIGNTQGISHRIRYDYLTNDLAFEVWEGKDRRDSQDINSWAVFSNSFRNIKNVVYNRNSSNYKNYAYVAGEGEGAARVIIEVDVRTDRSEKRRELFVDARDLRSEDGSGNKLTEERYRQLLIQRGKEKLAEYRKVETVNSGIDEEGMPIFDRAESSDFLAMFLSNIISDGVMALPKDCFQVVAYNGMELKVRPGFGIVRGRFACDTQEFDITIPNAPTSYKRIDRVVLSLRRESRSSWTNRRLHTHQTYLY